MRGHSARAVIRISGIHWAHSSAGKLTILRSETCSPFTAFILLRIGVVALQQNAARKALKQTFLCVK